MAGGFPCGGEGTLKTELLGSNAPPPWGSSWHRGVEPYSHRSKPSEPCRVGPNKASGSRWRELKYWLPQLPAV